MGREVWWTFWKRRSYNYLEPTKIALSEFKKLKAFERVAEIAEAAGFVEEAIINYARAEKYDTAISLAKQKNLTKKAEEIRRRVLLRYGKDARRYTIYAHSLNPDFMSDPEEGRVYVETVSVHGCGHVWSYSLEEYSRITTVEAEETKGNFYNAVLLAKFKKQSKKAKELYEEGIKYYGEKKDHMRAAALAKLIGNREKAKEFFALYVEKIKDTERKYAIDLAERESLWELAITMCVEDGKYTCAVKIAEKAGLLDIAEEYYEKAMKEWEEKKFFHLAAVMADKANFPRKATQLYQISLKKYRQELKEGIEFGAMFSSTLSNALKKDDPKAYQDLKANCRKEKYRKKLQEERERR